MNNLVAYKSEMDRSLKGLLMDKGELSIEEAFQQNQRKSLCIQKSMCDLVDMYQEARESYGVGCVGLYVVRNLSTGVPKKSKVETLSYFDQRGAMWLEWRASAEWGRHYGYGEEAGRGIRVVFDVGSNHFRQMKDFIEKQNKEFYEVLLAYENVRVSLNAANRTVRKLMSEIDQLRNSKRGLSLDCRTYSQKLLRSLSNGREIETLLYSGFLQ